VIYPDQQTQLIVPSTADFKQLSNLQHRLVTKVLLSHSVWSGKSTPTSSLSATNVFGSGGEFFFQLEIVVGFLKYKE